MTNPKRVLVAGDWHGNDRWAHGVIRRVPALLASESPRLILHCGDFGVWPGKAGVRYLRKLNGLLEEAGAVLWFVDGNHECFPILDQAPRVDGMGLVAERIWHLRRGHRWTWHGRTWLALGGGVSLDRAGRTEGESWWRDEEITCEQAKQVGQAGHADVMVTHDVPAGIEHHFPPPPSWWDQDDLDRNEAHRYRLRTVVDAVRPSYLIHGHLHRAYTRTVDFGWGALQVTGLDCDGAPAGNWAVLDVQTMRWQDTGLVPTVNLGGAR